MSQADVDLMARVRLCHAAVQCLADAHGIDLLHVKGPVIHPDLSSGQRSSTDADVIVRPDQAGLLQQVLTENQWRLVTSFRSGSVFEHAANFHHQAWGYVDVHRSFPGLTVPAADAFTSMWARREVCEVAQWEVTVPALVDQALLLVLHAARGYGTMQGREDVRLAFLEQSDDHQSAVRARADEFGAHLALAAGLGELDQLPEEPMSALWRYYSRGGSRAEEWRARWQAATTLRARAKVLWTAVGVNREFLAMEIGHQPSQAEMRAAFVGRIRNGIRSLRARRGPR